MFFGKFVILKVLVLLFCSISGVKNFQNHLLLEKNLKVKRSLIRKALNRLPEFSTTIGSPIYFIILLCKSYFSQFLTYSESFLLFVFYFHRKLRNVFSGIEIEELLLFSMTYQQATSVVKICLFQYICILILSIK